MCIAPEPTNKVHLIYTCIITNKALNKESARDYEHNNIRLEQFLSSLHSMNCLSISSANFYLEIDDEFSKHIQLIESQIKMNFKFYTLVWKRLELFQDWVDAKNEIPSETQLILLQSNFDHIYTLPSPIPFFQFCDSVIKAGPRSVGEITHWPEAISEFSRPWCFSQNIQSSDETLIRNTNLCVGTILVTHDLFCEWWDKDFTEGARIVRPDNPFGPSVRFPNANLVVPFIELFRHLDGYSHVGVKSKWAQALDPCCTIKDKKIRHNAYEREGFLQIKDNFINSNVLPDMEEKIDGLFLNRIVTAGAHRIDFSLLFKVGSGRVRNESTFLEYLIFIWTLLSIRPVKKLIPRFLFENIIIGTVFRLHRLVGGRPRTPQRNLYLSKVMSLGVTRGTLLILRINMRRLVKTIVPKALHRHFN